MQFDRENIKRIRGLIGFMIFLLVVLWNYKIVYQGILILWNVLRPFAAGAAIAFVLNAPVSFFEKKILRCFGTKARSFSLAFVLMLGLLLLGGVLFYLVPELGRTITHLGENVDRILPIVKSHVLNIVRGEPVIADWIANTDMSWATISDHLLRFLKCGLHRYPLGVDALRIIVSYGTNIAISFVFACYVILQKERLARQVKKAMYAFLPRDWCEIFLAFFSLSDDVFSRFLTGQCLESVILGCVFAGVLLLLRIPYPFLISLIVSLTSVVPVFGAFAGCVIGFLLIFIEAPFKAFLFLVVFLIIQQIEGDLIYPRIVGRSVGLPSVWVLFSVTVGAGLFGLVGMLLFIPLFSVFYSMFRGIVHRRLRVRGIRVE